MSEYNLSYLLNVIILFKMEVFRYIVLHDFGEKRFVITMVSCVCT